MVNDENGDALPPGWVWTTIEQITQPIEKVDPTLAPDAEFVYLDISSIDNSRNVISDPKLYRGNQAPSRARQHIRANDILFSTVRTYLRNIALVPENYDGQIASTGFSVLRAAQGIEPKYLFYLCLENDFLHRLEALQRGTSYPAIRDVDMREQVIPLPPLAEQQRIVEAIEAQFTRLDAGVAALKRLRASLRRYKAAVLKAAAEGRLVEQDPDDEPASELLQRILKERRAKWEAEQRAKGKDPRKLKYEEPAAPNTADLPDLPEGWVWATAEQLSAVDKYSMAIGPFGSNLMVKDYRTNGVPLIFVKEIRSGIFDRPGLPHITEEKAEELRAHHVHPGDLVITKMGEPPGDVAIFPEHIPLAVATSDCIKWSLSTHLRNRRYFMYTVRFPIVKKQILKITRGVAQQKMSLERFKKVAIPVAPLNEQDGIVDAVDEIFSNLDGLIIAIEDNIQRAERLRQSILREAFAGRLVPHDPDDEPASALLEKIHATRQVKKRSSKP